MIPKGIFAIGSVEPGAAERELEAIRERLSEEESVEYRVSHDRRCILGVVRSDLYPYPARLSVDEKQQAIGVFDGFTFEGSFLEHEPHRLCSMETDAVSAAANGMFFAASYRDGDLHVLTDPWATLPLYYSANGDGVFFSSSLSVINDLTDQNTDIFADGGGGDIAASQLRSHS